jgi:hypothetical protein
MLSTKDHQTRENVDKQKRQRSRAVLRGNRYTLGFGHWFGHKPFLRPCEGIGGCVQGAKRPAHTPRLPF